MSDSGTTSLKFNISNTDTSAELGIRVHLDGIVVYENRYIKEPCEFLYKITDNDGEHELKIVMFGKNPTHTKINEAGEIVKDAMLTINDIEFDGIDISQIFTVASEYHHDFNGTQSPTVEKFYGNLGCNGTVSLKFTTPLYLWLLENM